MPPPRPSTAKRSYDETNLSILVEVGEESCRHFLPVLDPNKKARMDVKLGGAKESTVKTERDGSGDEASGAQGLSVENYSAQGNISSSPDASSNRDDMASSESLFPYTSNPSQSLLGWPLLPQINTEIPASPDSNCSSPGRKAYVQLHVRDDRTLPPLQESKLAVRALITPLSSPPHLVSHNALASLPASEATASINVEMCTSETDGSSRSDTEDDTQGNIGSSQIADHYKKAQPVQASHMYDNNCEYSQALPPMEYSPTSATTPTISDFVQSLQQYAANNTRHKPPAHLRPKLDHLSTNHSYASPTSPQEEMIVQLKPTPGPSGKHYSTMPPHYLIFSRDGFPISR